MGFFSRIFGRGGGYDAVQSSKARSRAFGKTVWPADEDRHLGNYREILRLEGRSLDRNHGLLFGVLNRIADYSLPNVSLRFETDDDEYNREAEDFLSDWFRVSDVRGLNSFQDMAWLAVRTVNLDGDGGFLLLRDGRIQPVEAELIVTPEKIPDGKTIIQGVEIGALGQPLAFWIAPRHSTTGLPDRAKARRVDAFDFIFYRQFWRFDAVRGIPSCASILPDLLDQKELHRAYVRKTKSDATRAFAVHTDDGMMPENLYDKRGGDSSPEDGRPPTWEDSGLKAFFLRNTERVENISPATPSATIVQYEEAMVRQMSSALSIPAEFWTLDLRGLSWSTANAVVKIAGDAFRGNHTWAVDQFIHPMISWRLLMAIRDGDIKPPPISKRSNGLPRSQHDKFRVSIPEYLWADEGEHYKAAKLGWQLGAKSLDDIAGERGESAAEMLSRKKGDIAAAIQIAKELEKETGVPVSWDQIINAGTPGVVSMAEIQMRGKSNEEKK